MSYEAWNAGRLPPGATTTASANSAPKTFTVEDLKRLERELALMPKPQWALIAPDGQTWMDADPQALLRVLAMACYQPALPSGVPRLDPPCAARSTPYVPGDQSAIWCHRCGEGTTAGGLCRDKTTAA